MGSHYNQVTLEDRHEISVLRRSGASVRKIAATLDRSASSISRELRRNGCQDGPGLGYRPSYADQQAWARRWSGSRLERDAELRETVLGHLSSGWSPAQVAGRLKREHGHTLIGRETIYRFIYAQMKRSNDGAWRRYLPMGKGRRGWRSRKNRSPALSIKHRVPIEQRPSRVENRCQAGHWEADFMLFSRLGQSLLVLHERTSRLTAVVRTENRRAEPTADLLAELLRPLPSGLRRSLTFDNGTEFAEHHRLQHNPGLPTFFCDPYSPWQKGGVENAIGRIRRFLPRKIDLQALSAHDLARFIHSYNHAPRQCLDFATPAEVFSKVLHFKWDSAPSLRSG